MFSALLISTRGWRLALMQEEHKLFYLNDRTHKDE